MADAVAPCTPVRGVIDARIARAVATAALFALLIGLQLIYYTGVVASDDLGYIRLASGSAAFEPIESNHFLPRFVHWKLIGLSLAVLPNAPWTVGVPSTAAAIVVLLVMRTFAARHVGAHTANLAVLSFGCIPVNVVLASTALPDMVSAALAWTGLLIAAPACIGRLVRRAHLRCLLGALLIGMGYNAKETVAIFIPGLMLFLLIQHGPAAWVWARSAYLAAGGVAWLIIESLVLWRWTGDPWFHNHAIVKAHRGFAGPLSDFTFRNLLAYWSDYVRWLLDPTGDFGPIGVILLVGLTWAIVCGTRSLQSRPPGGDTADDSRAIVRLMLCLTIPAFIYLSFGSTELASYVPLIHQPRYLVPFLPAMCLLAAMPIRRVWANAPVWRPVMGVAGAAVLVASLVAPNRLAGTWYNADTFAAGYTLFTSRIPDGANGEPILASQLTFNRFAGLETTFGLPPFELIRSLPTTPAEWTRRYPGRLVLLTDHDRRPPSKPKPSTNSLHGPPASSLAGFERLARTDAPAGRLQTLAARLRGLPTPSGPQVAAALYRIPDPPPGR